MKTAVAAKLKPREISAIRHWPKGCGPFSPKPQSEEGKEADSSQKLESVESAGTPESEKSSVAETPAKVATTPRPEVEEEGKGTEVSPSQVRNNTKFLQFSRKRNLDQIVPLGRDEAARNPFFSRISPPPKRRRVSAVRDFPPGCGRNATPILKIDKIPEVVVANQQRTAEDSIVGEKAAMEMKIEDGEEIKGTPLEATEKIHREERKSDGKATGDREQKIKGGVDSKKPIGDRAQEIKDSAGKKPIGDRVQEIKDGGGKKPIGDKTRESKDSAGKKPIGDGVQEFKDGVRKKSFGDRARDSMDGVGKKPIFSKDSAGKKPIGDRALESKGNAGKKPIGDRAQEIKDGAGKKPIGDRAQETRGGAGKKPIGDRAQEIKGNAGKKPIGDRAQEINNGAQVGDLAFIPYGKRMIVQALMAAPNCPWRPKNPKSKGKSRRG